jgi:predicted ribosomally synthesized peptide with SipW-like signal peptide
LRPGKNIYGKVSRRKNMKKTGLLVLALVLALGALGIGYAAWSQTLTVNGNVSTGTYIVKVSAPSASPTDNTKTAWLSTANAGDASFDVTVHNGYPGFTGTVSFDITSTGTVPAKLTDVRLTPNGGTVVTSWDGTATSFDLTGGSAPGGDVTVSCVGIPTIGNTLPASSSCTATITIPGALATDMGGTTGTFKIEFLTSQNPAS